MTREEAIKELRGFIGQLTEGCQEAIKVLIPELAESEDEKIRKEIVSFIRAFWVDHRDSVPQASKWLAYLERQKDSPMPEDTVVFQKGVAEGRRLEREDMEKERKPIIDLSEFSDSYREGYNDGFNDGISKNLPEEIDSQIWQIANNSAKTWNESFAVLIAASDAYKRGKKDAQKEQKLGWSEEDKWTIDLTIAVLRENLPNGYFKATPTNNQNIGAIHTEELVKKLESLKNRGNFSSWKPSEEQMKVFFKATPVNLMPEELLTYQSLYDDLKKLM